MKKTGALLLLVFVIAANAHDRGKEGKDICDNNGVKYADQCAFATAQKETCGTTGELYPAKCPRNDTKTNRGKDGKNKHPENEHEHRGAGEKNFTVCGLGRDGNDKTYDNKCTFGFEKECQNVTIVHLGVCGNCSEGNVCGRKEESGKEDKKPAKDKHEDKKSKGKRHKRHSSVVCDSKGTKYTRKCDFLIARCLAFQADKSLPLLELKSCSSV